MGRNRQVSGAACRPAFQRFSRLTDPRTGLPMAGTGYCPEPPTAAWSWSPTGPAGRWADACRDFGETVARKLYADGLAAVWARLAGLIGRLEQTGRPVVYQAGDLTVADIPLSFEAGERTARIAFDREGKVAGLHFLSPGLT